MESVLLDLGGGVPAPSASGAKDKEEEKKREDTFKAAWEAMLVDGMDGLVDLDGFNGKASASNDAESVEDAFQKSVRQAMERLKASEDTLQADASAGQEDELEKLLASLGEGGGDDDALHGILEGMMGQLMSKDVLYEPLKELNEKFPEYLATNATKLPADDLARYKAQQASVSKIIVLFDDPSYSDSDATKGAEIVNLMSEMQSHGSPPAEIMGPMPPGLDLGADGIPKVPDGCTIS
ncbi:Pex19 protein [Auriscalpium vulgare]|uniref:Pex19 protein n=1 Tax=Auriscalpium vulgare TaxID=40419 RepID=A0ACB8S5Y9_9AGAM|nr:Pex19 protein [Auriscalpium vulgare]